MYGIPTYRLPRDIVDREVGVIASLGIEISVDRTVRSATELKRGYDAALVAVGARKGNIPPLGEMKTCGNVWAAVDFCRMAARGALPEMGNTLAVIGGGNVAFDCARIAKKDRVKTVYVICLESREAMLADDDEIEAAMDEGIEILNDRTCISAGISNGKVRSLELKSVDSFSFGPNGLDLKTRDNSEHRIDIDSLVFATGQSVDLPETFDAETGRGYALIVDETYKTSMGGVFAAGDCVTGTKSVVEAVAAGREAASNIDLYLGGDGVVDEHYWDREELRENIGTIEGFAQLERISVLDGVDASERECTRCLQCDLRLNIASERFWTDDFYTSKKMG
jgi:NADPH-dependent glutamate synthase beta subunit-like oxidoreductase